MNRALRSFAIIVPLLLGSATAHTRAVAPPPAAHTAASRIAIENVEGILFLRADLSGGTRDTSGLLVLDTGAGYLGLDHAVARRLEVTDETPAGDVGIRLAARALGRLTLGDIVIDQVAPVLLLDLGVVKRVTGRSALGLLGQRIFTGRALWIDYETETLSVMPNPPTSARPGSEEIIPTPESLRESRELFGAALSRKAVPAPFRLLGDGKMMVRVHAGAARPAGRPDRWLNLVFDTGATQCVFFEPELVRRVPAAKKWRSVEGLVAPTLFGDARLRLTLAPWLTLAVTGKDPGHVASQRNVECAVVRSDLGATLSAAVGEPVHGLLGYSFLRNYRIGIDFTRNLVWLDPIGRPVTRVHEHTHVGMQLESSDGGLRVSAVARKSPADDAKIAAGDEVISIDGRPVREQDVIEAARRLEGPPGSTVRLVVRRGATERTVTLVRRRLL